MKTLLFVFLVFFSGFCWAQDDAQQSDVQQVNNVQQRDVQEGMVQKRDVMLCPFKETVVVKDAPAGTQILSLSADKLAVDQQGTQQFIIYNKKTPCSNGTVTARIGIDNNNYAEITFHDGPWIFMDIKSVKNVGSFKFSKWNPDYVKHYYELNFSSTETE